MAYDPIAARYAGALFHIVQRDGGLELVLEQLHSMRRLLQDTPALSRLMRHPQVPVAEKVALLDRVARPAWSAPVRAFVQMVLAAGRAEWLPEMVEAFQAAADNAQGRMRAIVRSARPLSSSARERLRRALERQEGRTVELDLEEAPELIGGFQVSVGHRRLDASVQRHVAELRERLMTVRVH